MVQPPDYYILMAMQAQPRRYHPLPVRAPRTPLRDRIRTLLTRSTLGPIAAERGREGQWWTLEGCETVR